MILENLLGGYLYIDGRAIAPGATATIADADYNKDDILAGVINAAYAAGSIDVASPPSGFPRGDEHTGGATVAISNASDVPIEDDDENFTADNVEDALTELFESLGSGGPATNSFSIFHFGTRSDDTGEASFEPADMNFGSNDVARQMLLGLGSALAAAPTVKHGAYGSFNVPIDYVGTSAKIVFIWSSTLTSGDVVYDFDYRAISGNDTESLDQSSWQESVTVTDTAPSAARERQTCEVVLTHGNIVAGDTVLFFVGRDGVAGGDTLAGRAYVVDVIFEYGL